MMDKDFKDALLRRLGKGVGAVAALACLAAPMTAVAAEPSASSDETATRSVIDDLLDYDVTITYDGNGATGGSTAATKGHAGDSLRAAENGFTRGGFTFTGWNTLPNGTGVTVLPDEVLPKALLRNVTLYAQWRQNTNDASAVTITYDGNGATGGSTAATKGHAGDLLTVAKNGFTRSGFTFLHWNTKADGTGLIYLPDAHIWPQRSVTLYAQWKSSDSTGNNGSNGSHHGGNGSTGNGSTNGNGSTTLPGVPQSVDDVRVTTFAGTAPKLPSTVTVRYSDNTTKQQPVTWDSNRDWTTTRPSVIPLVGTVSVGALKLASTAVVTVKAPFTDVTILTPHDTDIYWLSGKGITTGYKDGTFRGMTPVYRQDMAAFLYRLAGSPAFSADHARNPFSDVTKDTPHYKEILWLYSTGISEGWKTADGKVEFRGMDSVKRQDMAAFLRRLAVYEGVSGAKDYRASASDKAEFVDVDDSTPHAQDVWWLASTGVSTGWTDHTFRGMGSVVRQDMAAFLHRMSANVLK